MKNIGILTCSAPDRSVPVFPACGLLRSAGIFLKNTEQMFGCLLL